MVCAAVSFHPFLSPLFSLSLLSFLLMISEDKKKRGVKSPWIHAGSSLGILRVGRRGERS
jgi:hypothetical protein